MLESHVHKVIGAGLQGPISGYTSETETVPTQVRFDYRNGRGDQS
jgi:hypothetical protein